MSAYIPEDLRLAADVLWNHWDVAYDSLCNSRDRARRVSDDRDSEEVLADLISDLRAAADKADKS